VARVSVAALVADERVRFLVVGGINTVVGYLLFAALQLSVGHVIGYLGSLYGSYVLAVTLAFVLHRRFTFRVEGTGSRLVDFVRFASVYVVSLAANTVVLPLLVELARLDPLVAQAISVVVTTIVSYFGHKYFSFRRTTGA
jgi:putative flippase GtrA